jgi:hypothetical protein
VPSLVHDGGGEGMLELRPTIPVVSGVAVVVVPVLIIVVLQNGDGGVHLKVWWWRR